MLPSLTDLLFLQLGLNALADLTHEEYKQKYALGYRKFQRSENRLTTFSHGDIDEATLPQEIDWRKQNAVAEVKNQQQVSSYFSNCKPGRHADIANRQFEFGACYIPRPTLLGVFPAV